MKKRPAPVKKAAKNTTSDDHRKLADRHRARSQLHEAKANLLDIDEPPKKGKVTVRPY